MMRYFWVCVLFGFTLSFSCSPTSEKESVPGTDASGQMDASTPIEASPGEPAPKESSPEEKNLSEVAQEKSSQVDSGQEGVALEATQEMRAEVPTTPEEAMIERPSEVLPEAKTTPEPSASPFHKNISIQEALNIIKTDKGIVLLDVRTAREYTAGHLANSQNIDFYNAKFSDMLKPLDRNKRYLVYCASGVRSAKTLRIMKGLGFVYVYNMLGGYSAWSRAGYPVTR